MLASAQPFPSDAVKAEPPAPRYNSIMVDELRDAAVVLSDEHVEYAAELQRRIAEIDAGTATLLSADESMANARKALN